MWYGSLDHKLTQEKVPSFTLPVRYHTPAARHTAPFVKIQRRNRKIPPWGTNKRLPSLYPQFTF